jgi:tetratricopeptide (TPR) repeat protein
MIPAMKNTRSDHTGRPAAAERELSLTPEQALALAIERHQLDQLDDAEMIYAALLERWPDHPDALNYMGVLKHQRGEDDAALDLLRRAVEVGSRRRRHLEQPRQRAEAPAPDRRSGARLPAQPRARREPAGAGQPGQPAAPAQAVGGRRRRRAGAR